jgi:hypothetical protein
MKRSLSLKRETLTQLATDDLVNVIGAYPTPVVRTLPPTACLSLILAQCP